MKLPRIRLRAMFRRTGGGEDHAGLVDRTLEGVRNVDPDTDRAWSRLAANLDGDPVRLHVDVGTRLRFSLRPVLWSGLALTAVAAVFVFLLPRDAPRVYTTARAQQSTVILPDSTVVTLNHTSTLIVQPQGSGGHRLVILEGEAYFQVRHNGSPFIVMTRAGSIEVLGTAFNVRAREQTTDLELLNGRVRFATGLDRTGESVVLTEGQRSRCVAGQAPSAPVSIQHQSAPAWMEGKFVCDQLTLADISKELEETYDVAIAIADPALGAVTVTGTIEARSADKALQSLCLLTGYRYRQDHATFILY